MRLPFFVLSALLLWSLYALYLGEDGFQGYVRLKAEVKAQQQLAEWMRERNVAMRMRQEELTQGGAELETLARFEKNMLRNNERLVRIIP